MFKLLDYKVLNITKKANVEIPKGVSMIGAPLEWKETKGEGLKVCVIDTGCPQHKDIKVEDAFVSPGLKNANKGDVYDHAGHATHVSGSFCANGAILGVAPLAKLYTAKVLDDTGHGDENTIAAGIRWAIKQKVDIINMSLGGKSYQKIMHEAVKEAHSAGIKIICASGNSGGEYLAYPAKFPEAIAVGAVDPDKKRPNFSSIGPEVEVCAPGTQIFSCWLNNQYATLQGTSMASPHYAGAAALLDRKMMIRRGRKLTLEELRLVSHMYSEDLGKFGKDDEYGFGVFSFGRVKQSDAVGHEVKVTMGECKYFVDGYAKQSDVGPVILNDRMMIPLRIVSEGMGHNVQYFEDTKTAIVY